MTKRPQKRNNDYYLDRLRKLHPTIYQQLQDGAFKTKAEAFRAAGLRKSRTPLQELRSAWKRASASERDTFLKNILPAPASIATPSVTTAPAFVDHRLTPHGKSALQRFMSDRGYGSRMGQVMKEIGRDPRDTSLSTAVHRGTQIQSDVAGDIERLLTDAGYL